MSGKWSILIDHPLISAGFWRVSLYFQTIPCANTMFHLPTPESSHQASKKNIRLGFLRLGLRRLGLLALLRWFRQFVVHQLVQLAAGETTYLYIFIYIYVYIYVCVYIYILHKYVYIYIHPCECHKPTSWACVIGFTRVFHLEENLEFEVTRMDVGRKPTTANKSFKGICEKDC